MKIQAVIVATALSTLFCCGSLAFGQGGPGRPGPEGRHAFGFHSGKVITSEPYSADLSNASVQTLAGGNTIQRTTTGHVARDSEGRTYSQEVMTGLWGQSGTRTVTFISDPVAGYAYTLNAETKTATRRALHVPQGDNTTHFSSRPANPNAVTADLGTQMVGGVSAVGKKVTHTIPAGAMGNAQPIVSTSQVWTSPDLQVVVSATRTDPREGNSTYTLTNIQRAEPAASLFQVPADYTVKDAPSFGRAGASGKQ
jgi:hypothetical protein